MNKIIVILPNAFEFRRDWVKIKKNIFANYRMENIIALPVKIFQPHVMVYTIILYLTIQNPTTHFYHYSIENDGYTDNRKREKKAGENDFDIFWKYKDSSEEEKLKNGFQKLELTKIKDNGYNTIPKLVNRVNPNFEDPNPRPQWEIAREKLDLVEKSIRNFEENIKLSKEYLLKFRKEKKELLYYFYVRKKAGLPV